MIESLWMVIDCLDSFKGMMYTKGLRYDDTESSVFVFGYVHPLLGN